MAAIGFVNGGSAVVSGADTSDALYKMLNASGYITAKKFSLVLDGVANDTTNFANATFLTRTKALRGGRWSITAYTGTPIDGVQGLVTYANGYATNINTYSLRISRQVADITPYQNTGRWRTMTQGLVEWGGSYSGFLDASTPIKVPVQTSNEFATATFQLLYHATQAGLLTGSIAATQVTSDVEQNRVATVGYSFVGTSTLVLTSSTSTSLLWQSGSPTTTDTSGATLAAKSSANNTLTLTAASGRTYAGTPLWSGINIECRTGQPIMFTIDGVFTGGVAVDGVTET